MEIMINVSSLVVKCTENVEETFFTYSVFSFPESIDFLSRVIISGWMSSRPTGARDVRKKKKNHSSAGVSNAVDQKHLL